MDRHRRATLGGVALRCHGHKGKPRASCDVGVLRHEVTGVAKGATAVTVQGRSNCPGQVPIRCNGCGGLYPSDDLAVATFVDTQLAVAMLVVGAKRRDGCANRSSTFERRWCGPVPRTVARRCHSIKENARSNDRAFRHWIPKNPWMSSAHPEQENLTACAVKDSCEPAEQTRNLP